MPIEPICLACNHPIKMSNPEVARCTNCGRAYPLTFGIPDLRDAPTVDDQSDELIVKHLLEHYTDADFARLLEIRNRYAPTASDLRGHEVNYVLSSASRGQNMIEMFQSRASEFFPIPGQEAALDIGCGTGAGLQVLAKKYRTVVGMDPSLPDLILARKALEVAGIPNVQLIQAYGQKVPYPEGSFDYINALNVLEHVFDLKSVLAEVYRLLKPSGIFSGDSRNRFDPFFPEPHVKVRWVGFVPRKYTERYVRWRAGVAYNHTYLFSYKELKSCLKEIFGREFTIVFPYVDAYGGPGWLNVWLRNLERLPVLSILALSIFPSHLVLARRL
jgi:ubiquinone/menaquinone biosynthesis C-methylase UbiE